jgi:peptidyl-prolyl cis-trans isomerase D
MFEMMRRNTKLIMWITAGSFVLLIFLAWGAEYSLGGKGKGRTAGVIGRVNGEAVTARVYQDRVLAARENWAQQQQQNPDEAAEVQIRDQAWNNLIQEMLVKQEIKRRGIQVSDREIAEAIRTQPIPQIMQSPDFQTNGQFDYNKYLSAIDDPNRDWLPLESYYRDELPKQKLQSLVMAAVKISDADIRRQYADENVKAKAAYAFVPASSYIVDKSTIDDATAKAFYESHADDYRTDAQAWIQMVRIEKKPTVSDTLAARDLIQQAQREAKDGEDFGVLVSAYSEAPPQLRGGDQGAYVPREQFASPTLSAAISTVPIGQISDVITESGGFHLFRVEDRRVNATSGKEEVKIADIFVPIALSSETLSGHQDRAMNLARAAQEGEASLSDAAKADGLTAIDQGPFGRTSYLRGIGQVGGFMDWAFNAAPGKITALESVDSWYVARLVRHRPAGLAPYEEVADRVKGDCAAAQQTEQAKQAAQRVLESARAGSPLEQAAKAVPAATFGQTDEFARRGFARGLGSDPAVLDRVFNDPVGLVPQVIPTKRGAYVLEILSRGTLDESAIGAQRESIRQAIAQRQRKDLLNRWMEEIRSQAKIEDYRFDSQI